MSNNSKLSNSSFFQYFIPGVKWTEVAEGFEKKLQIPSCVGGIVTKIVQVPKLYEPPRGDKNFKFYAIVIIFVDANMRIICHEKYRAIGVRPKSTRDMVEECLSDSKFYLPPARPPRSPYAFIGGEHFNARENLIVPSKNARYDASQFERGLKPAKVVDDLLTKRFGILEKGIPNIAEELSPLLFIVCFTFHNYLLANSPA